MLHQQRLAIFILSVFLAACSRSTPPAEVVYEQTPTAYHVVKSGQSVASIAAQYHMDKNELVRLNGLKPPYRLITGQRLLVTRRAASEPTIKLDKQEAETIEAQALPPPPGVATTELPGVTPPEAIKKAELAVPTSAGAMVWPVKGRIIKGFTSQDGKRGNDGINIAAPKGTSIVAADNGVVARIGNQLKGFGNFVLIRHEKQGMDKPALMTIYTHMDTISVKENSVIQRGQEIGTVGTSGQVQEPQVHFEVRQGTTPIDPARYLQ